MIKYIVGSAGGNLDICMGELMKKDMKGKVILSMYLPALDMDAGYLILKAQHREVGTNSILNSDIILHH